MAIHRFLVGLVLVLVGLGGCGGRCATHELYQDVAIWLDAYALPSEVVAVPASARACFADRSLIELPASLSALEALEALDAQRPEIVVAVNSVCWDGVRAQPWFRERYRLLQSWDRAGVSYAPVQVFGYKPSPYEGDGQIEVSGAFESDAVVLRGYELGNRRLRPAETLYVTLYWDAVPGVAFDGYRSIIELVSVETGEGWAQRQSRLQVTGLTWQPGSRLAQHYALLSPEELSHGTFRVTVRLFAPGGRPVPVSDAGPDGERQEALTLTTVHHPPDVSQSAIPMNSLADYWFAAVDGSITLAGYDIPLRVSPGDHVPLTLLWSASVSPSEDYHVFVHLVSDEGELVAQDDGVPVDGSYPTSSWDAGDFVRDEHWLLLTEDLARGDYSVLVGLYDPTTGERLPAYTESGTEIADASVRLTVLKVR